MVEVRVGGVLELATPDGAPEAETTDERGAEGTGSSVGSGSAHTSSLETAEELATEDGRDEGGM